MDGPGGRGSFHIQRNNIPISYSKCTTLNSIGTTAASTRFTIPLRERHVRINKGEHNAQWTMEEREGAGVRTRVHVADKKVYNTS